MTCTHTYKSKQWKQGTQLPKMVDCGNPEFRDGLCKKHHFYLKVGRSKQQKEMLRKG